MINELESALKMTRALLLDSNNITEDNINEAVNQIRLLQLGGGLQSVDLNVLKEKLIEMFHATMDHARILEGKERR